MVALMSICRASLRSCRPTFAFISLFLSFGFSAHAQAHSAEISPSTNTAKTNLAPNALPRLISLSPHITEMLFSIGAGKQIIATSEYSDYPKAATKIARVGNYLSLQIERIIALNPDYIIAWRGGSPAKDLARLQKLGFTIIYSAPKTFSDIANDLITFGKISGHQQQATKLAKRFLARLYNIKKLYQDKKNINTFYELWSAPLTTIAKNSWPQQHLNICHATNVFYDTATPYPIVGIEQVITKKIDLIIVPLSKKQTDKQGYDCSTWQQINAVKYQQFIYPNSDKMHRMTLRALDELERLCQQIDDVRDFYEHKRDKEKSNTPDPDLRQDDNKTIDDINTIDDNR